MTLVSPPADKVMSYLLKCNNKVISALCCRNILWIKFVLKGQSGDVINAGRLPRWWNRNLWIGAADMLMSHKWFLLLRPSSSPVVTLSVSHLLRCFHGRSALFSRCPAGPRRNTAGTGLPLSAQEQRRVRSLFPAGPVQCCRGASTSPVVRSDVVGKIQSTHYRLVYTCKVAENSFSLTIWPESERESLTHSLYHVCRFAPLDPRSRFPSWPTTRV